MTRFTIFAAVLCLFIDSGFCSSVNADAPDVKFYAIEADIDKDTDAYDIFYLGMLSWVTKNEGKILNIGSSELLRFLEFEEKLFMSMNTDSANADYIDDHCIPVSSLLRYIIFRYRFPNNSSISFVEHLDLIDETQRAYQNALTDSLKSKQYFKDFLKQSRIRFYKHVSPSSDTSLLIRFPGKWVFRVAQKEMKNEWKFDFIFFFVLEEINRKIELGYMSINNGDKLHDEYKDMHHLLVNYIISVFPEEITPHQVNGLLSEFKKRSYLSCGKLLSPPHFWCMKDSYLTTCID